MTYICKLPVHACTRAIYEATQPLQGCLAPLIALTKSLPIQAGIHCWHLEQRTTRSACGRPPVHALLQETATPGLLAPWHFHASRQASLSAEEWTRSSRSVAVGCSNLRSTTVSGVLRFCIDAITLPSAKVKKATASWSGPCCCQFQC